MHACTTPTQHGLVVKFEETGLFNDCSSSDVYSCLQFILELTHVSNRRYGSAVPFHGRHCTMSSAVAAEQLLESEDIERMDWPARSPDLNPIKHVWEFLGRRLAARTLPPVTIREL
ncbi:hypothetical protein TNCV_1597151 [Trichonephila clavipes]|nr:hypothetical protein TNCV_1597151 [Trichonephila clavipes]